jgi:hypothetical protein
LDFIAGLACGAAVVFAVTFIPAVNEDRFLFYALLPCLRLAIGLAQSQVIRPFIPYPSQWIVATFIGYLCAIIPVVVPLFPYLPDFGLLDDALFLAVLGALIGLAQWLVLRRTFHAAIVWILASAVSLRLFFGLLSGPSALCLERSLEVRSSA